MQPDPDPPCPVPVPAGTPPEAVRAAAEVARYLARRDVPRLDADSLGGPVDLLVLAGSAVLASAQVVAAAWRDGLCRRVLVTGGTGHSTVHLHDAVRAEPALRRIAVEDRAEADVLADVLTGPLAVPSGALLVEREAAHTGANAALSLELLEREGVPAATVLLVQDPTMQRRTHATFERAWAGRDVRLTSWAPCVPEPLAPEPLAAGPRPAWTWGRFCGLLDGEVRRLTDDADGYGPRGRNHFDAVDLPERVREAARLLARLQPDAVAAR